MGIMSDVNVDRRSLLKGAALFGGAAVASSVMASGLVGCSSGGSGSGSQNAQAPSVSYDDGQIVAADAEWEQVCVVENSGLIEGMNWHEGELWFIDVATSKIQKVTDGKAVTLYEDKSHKAMPNGAKFIDDTTMLIADRAQGLCTYDTKSGKYQVHTSGYKGEKFLGLNDLVLDGNGGVYITDPGQSDCLTRDGSVYYCNYGKGGYEVELWAKGFGYPNGITISPDGQFLYVAEFNTNSIICVPSKAYTAGKDTPYVHSRLVGGHGPDGVLTDADGNVYAAHLGAGEVSIVDVNGFAVKNVRLPQGTSPQVSNLLIHDGYLYVCNFGDGVIWRIATTAQPNPLA